MVTAGNIDWAWDRPPSHLASKGEVLDHFQHCLDTIGKNLRVVHGGLSAADHPHRFVVVGDGRTTVHALVTAYPRREVNLIAGSGTLFDNRDIFFPEGLRRWRSGTMVSDLADQMAGRFDGTNEDAIWDLYRTKYGLSCTPETGNFLMGMLSVAERDTISAGLSQVLSDHFVDVAQSSTGPGIIMRAGTPIPVEAGSRIVNCTGYVTVREHPYEPYRSPGGRVLSIQMGSATVHLPSVMAYFGVPRMRSGLRPLVSAAAETGRDGEIRCGTSARKRSPPPRPGHRP